MLSPALAHPDFRRYVAGAFFALNGVWMQRITIAWLGWSLTGSAAYVGALAFVMMLPTLLLGPLLGVVADRVNLRRTAQRTQGALLLASAALALTHATGALGPLLLGLLSLLIGLITALHHPVRMALAPRLVPAEEIGAAVPVISINFNLSRFLGPLLAGVLIATIGVGPTLWLTAAAFAPLVVILMHIRLRPRREARVREPFLRSFRAGLAHARGDQLILTGIAMTMLTAVASRGVQDILPVIADGVFARGPSGLGQMTAAAGFGAILSSLWLIRHPVTAGDTLPRSVIAGAWISITLVALLAFAPTWPLALFTVSTMAGAGTLVGVGTQSAIQIRLPDTMRGRVMSLWTSTAIGSTAIGALILGAGADALGLRPTLIAATGVSAVGLAVVLLRYRVALRASASSRSRNRDRSILENGLPPP